jgi:hypothetical protein
LLLLLTVFGCSEFFVDGLIWLEKLLCGVPGKHCFEDTAVILVR